MWMIMRTSNWDADAAQTKKHARENRKSGPFATVISPAEADEDGEDGHLSTGNTVIPP